MKCWLCVFAGQIKRSLVFFLLGVVTMMLALDCIPRAEVTSRHPAVRVVGSTALLPVARDAAQLMGGTERAARVEVFGGGSLTGLQQVAGGWADVALSLVEPPPGEPLYQGLTGKVFGVMPLVLVVHPGVRVDNLSKDDATRIFLGQVKNWAALGGPDLPIVIVSRGKSSGSRQLIKRLVLGGREFTGNARLVNSDFEVRKAVASTPGAIGYLGATYLNGSVKALKYNGIECTVENVANGSYPLYGVARVYTRGKPAGTVQSYSELLFKESFLLKEVRKGLVPLRMLKKGPETLRSGVKGR